jgi:hypothetical protein
MSPAYIEKYETLTCAQLLLDYLGSIIRTVLSLRDPCLKLSRYMMGMLAFTLLVAVIAQVLARYLIWRGRSET